MTPEEFDTQQEYYETEWDCSEFDPTVPMPEEPPFDPTDEDYPFDDYNFDLDQ